MAPVTQSIDFNVNSLILGLAPALRFDNSIGNADHEFASSQIFTAAIKRVDLDDEDDDEDDVEEDDDVYEDEEDEDEDQEDEDDEDEEEEDEDEEDDDVLDDDDEEDDDAIRLIKGR